MSFPTGTELTSVQAIPNASFDLSTLTGSFQALNGSGLADDIKQLVIYNGGTVGVDISYDGVTKHDFWPAGATMIFDYQATHANQGVGGQGTKYLRKGQIIWGRTSTTSTFLQMSGYR
jgi:hypothetical protein